MGNQVRIFFANPYNHHNYFTVTALAELGDLFIICPPLELQLLFGRWMFKPRTTWLGFIPFCLSLWCTLLFLCLKFGLITTKSYIYQYNEVCSIVASRIPGLIWVHYQDYVKLSNEARNNIKADICELIIKKNSLAQGWSSTMEASLKATILIAPNTQTLTPILQIAPSIKAFVAPYGGDILNYLQSASTDSYLNEDVAVFVISARANSYRKGLDIFLEALLILASGYLSDRPLFIDCTLCGHLVDRLAINYYRKIKASLACNNKIKLRVKGYSQSSYLQQLKQSSLFVMPSRSEGMSTAALEALWLGVPCILSSHCGISSFVPDRHGFELNPLDPIALASYIARCIDDNFLMASYRTNLVNDKEIFSWDAYALAYAKVFSTIDT